MQWKVVQCEDNGDKRVLFEQSWNRFSKNKDGQKIDGRNRVWMLLSEHDTREEAYAALKQSPKVDKRAPVIPVDLVIPATPKVPEPITASFDPSGATEIKEQVTAPVPITHTVERKKPGPKPKTTA